MGLIFLNCSSSNAAVCHAERNKTHPFNRRYSSRFIQLSFKALNCSIYPELMTCHLYLLGDCDVCVPKKKKKRSPRLELLIHLWTHNG